MLEKFMKNLVFLRNKAFHSCSLPERSRIYFLIMEYLKAGEELRETIEELKVRVQWFEENLG